MDRFVGGLLIYQIPGDKNNVPLCILEGPLPSQQAQVWKCRLPSLWFFFLKTNNKSQLEIRTLPVDLQEFSSGQGKFVLFPRLAFQEHGCS